MQKVLVVVFILLFISCQHDSPQPVLVNSVFQPYLDTFLAEGKKRGRDFQLDKEGITIKLAKLDPKYYGIAYRDTRTIEMDSLWLKTNDFVRQRMLFHELGHLLLKRDHILSYLPNGEAKSLMWTPVNNLD